MSLADSLSLVAGGPLCAIVPLPLSIPRMLTIGGCQGSSSRSIPVANAPLRISASDSAGSLVQWSPGFQW
jgi:hypothetical protein